MAEVGRPHFDGREKEVLEKLHDAFSIGATNREAALYAEISERTLYEYFDKNPEYSQKVRLWKDKPILKARQELVKGLTGNPELALKFLERKRKKEFGMSLGLEIDTFGEENRETLKVMAEKLAQIEAQKNETKYLGEGGS